MSKDKDNIMAMGGVTLMLCGHVLFCLVDYRLLIGVVLLRIGSKLCKESEK